MKPLTISAKLTNRDNDYLRQYFRDIYAYKKFTPEEEAGCAFKSSNGDETAMNELINRNLRFVVSVAKQYENKDCLLGDLINEGNLGLIYAAKRFKPDMGFKFISYAVWWIRKYINEYQSNNGRTVRIPLNKITNLSKINQKMASLEQKLGRSVDIEDVICEYGSKVSDEEIKVMSLLNVFSVDSLDRDVSSDNDGAVTLGDLINDDSYFTPTDYLVNTSDVNDQLNRLLNTLKPKEKDIISSLFGLNGGQPLSISEVAKKYDVCSEAIRLSKERILKKLRTSSNKCAQTIDING
jgi:RNA polymerase primary sigma factor